MPPSGECASPRTIAVHNCTAPFRYLPHDAGMKKAVTLKSAIDPYVTDLLGKIEEGKTVLRLQKDEKALSQGEAAEAIYFIQTGKLKVTVVSSVGKEAVLAMLGPRGFLG